VPQRSLVVGTRELGAARAVGQEAEVPDADEAARDDVEEKATDEFLGRERHDLHAVAVGGSSHTSGVQPRRTAAVDKPGVRSPRWTS